VASLHLIYRNDVLVVSVTELISSHFHFVKVHIGMRSGKSAWPAAEKSL